MRHSVFKAQDDSSVSVGNQDLQLLASVVIFPGSITISKETDLVGSTQVFDYELTRSADTVDILGEAVRSLW